MTKNKQLVLSALVACFAAGACLNASAAPLKAKTGVLKAIVPDEIPAGAVVVSNYEYNTFVFPGPVKRLIFSTGTPLASSPTYLAGNTQALVQFEKSTGAAKTYQVIASMESGEVVQFRVAPREVPGIVQDVVTAGKFRAPPKAKSEKSTESAPRGEDIELLKALIASNAPPSGFEPVGLPGVTRFDKFSVVPLAGWSDGTSKRIMVFSLVAAPDQVSVVAPPQFYRPGITAVMLDGDTVDATSSPQLFVVEEIAND